MNHPSSNQPQPQTQHKPLYYLQRPMSPKNITHANSAKNISLNMTIGPNQTHNHFITSYKTKQELPLHSNDSKNQKYLQNEMKIIFKQNAVLKEQNEILRRQLQKLKKQANFEGNRPSERGLSASPEGYNDLRGTIKKEMGQFKEMRIKVEMLSKQCKMYEEIIDKMDEKIKKLTHEGSRKNSQIDELQGQLLKLEQLKEKVNGVMRMYSDLESKFNDHQLEWMKWKQGWLAERESYLDKIRELERRRGSDCPS